MVKKIFGLILCNLFFSSNAVFAEGPVPSVQSAFQSIDMMWIMLGMILVFFMHAGFAMVETGFTRSKNSLNILMKNFLTISIGSILYFLIGYAFMFGGTDNRFIGMEGFLLVGADDKIGFFIFQAVFAATCATIISGAVAERMKLSAYILITLIMSSFIYPVVGHWIWGGGWLSQLGFIDFAGSTVVHLTGASGALISVIFLGSRIGKYSKGKINVIPGHNIPLGALGVFILWFGWFGFNGGSTLAADPKLVPHVMTTTLLAASMSIISSGYYSVLKYKKMDPSVTLNGALAGLVGITAGCAEVTFIGAIAIGFIAGILLVEAVQFIDIKLKIDDPVGAIAVHGVGGIWGTIAVGLFSATQGLFYGGGMNLFLIQSAGTLAVMIWTVAAASIFLFFVTKMYSIRVTREEEISGLDFAEHGSSAYETTKGIFNENLPDEVSSFGLGLVKRLDSLPVSKKLDGIQ